MSKNRIGQEPRDFVIQGEDGRYLQTMHVGGKAWWTEEIYDAWHFAGIRNARATRIAARVNGTIERHERATP